MDFKEFSEYTDPESKDYDINSAFNSNQGEPYNNPKWVNEDEVIDIPEDTVDYLEEEEEAIDIPEEEEFEEQRTHRR